MKYASHMKERFLLHNPIFRIHRQKKDRCLDKDSDFLLAKIC